MNLTELQNKLGDNFDSFKDEVRDFYIKDKDTLYGVEFEVILSDREDEDALHIIKIGDSYFEQRGVYDSWNGTDWDCAEFYQVRPVEVTRTEYQPV
jgi:hypothetical protein